eukprot:symbB.v1.2.034281.t1/scaffold4397.1/size40204/1
MFAVCFFSLLWCHVSGDVSELFSCNDSHFDGSWTSFGHAIAEWTQLSTEAISTSQGLLIGYLERWQEAYPAFDGLIRWGPGELQKHERDELWRQLDGLCVFGMLTALFVMSKGEMMKVPDDPEVSQMGAFPLDRAYLLLGQELQYDFLSSSGWPARSIEIAALRFSILMDEGRFWRFGPW